MEEITVFEPIHGNITIESELAPIIEQPEFQRLRRISQGGICQQVFPSVSHSRFLHSIGTYYISKELTASIELPENKKLAIRTAALLHDVGHLPFSHTTELIDTGLPEHEELSAETVRNFEDRDLIQADTDLVIDLITGEEGLNLVSGAIDVDRMDYVQRDSYFAGLSGYSADIWPLIDSMEIQNGQVVFNSKNITPIISFLQTRLALYSQVYYHPTKKIVEGMLQKALLEDTPDKDELKQMEDWELRSWLSRSDNEQATELFNRIQNRNLYKKAYTSTEETDKTEQAIKEHILDTTTIPEHKLIVHKTNPSVSETILIKDEQTEEINTLDSYVDTTVYESMKDTILSLGVYVDQEYVDKVETQVKHYLS